MRIHLIALLTTFVGGQILRAADWPQYMGPNRDGVWPETGIIDQFPDGGPKVRWRVPVNPGYTGPAVVGGRVFLMDRVLAPGAKNHNESLFPHRPSAGIPGSERIVCFDASTGKVIWKQEYDCPYTVSYPNGPRCTPTVHEGLVYALGTEGHLHCIKAATGEIVWKKDFGKEYGTKPPLWGHSAHPLIDGKKLICVVGGDGTTAMAFDKDTGTELWRSLSSREQGYCAPMIWKVGDQRQLIIWHSEAINGLDPETGKVQWTESAKTYQGMSISTPPFANNMLFVTAYPATSMMLKLDADHAAVKWVGDKKNKLGFNSVFSSPHFVDGHIYGVNSGGLLTCIKADTGARLWESGMAHGPKPEGSAEIFLVRNGNRWILANEQGDLIIAKMTPAGYQEISRAHFLEKTSSAFGRSMVWSHPAYSGRCAFMRNDKELICVEMGAATSAMP